MCGIGRSHIPPLVRVGSVSREHQRMMGKRAWQQYCQLQTGDVVEFKKFPITTLLALYALIYKPDIAWTRNFTTPDVGVIVDEPAKHKYNEAKDAT